MDRRQLLAAAQTSNAAELATYVVEKGKPLLTLAK
jgi:hypothetical protein